MLANFFVPILDDGWRFIAIFAAITFLAALTGAAWLFWPLFALTLWSIYFFRDPSRGVPQDDDVLVAPADGLVQMVVEGKLVVQQSGEKLTDPNTVRPQLSEALDQTLKFLARQGLLVPNP